MELGAKIEIDGFRRNPFLGRINFGPESGSWVVSNKESQVIAQFRIGNGISTDKIFILPETFSYLQPGDILRINPQAGEARVLYRKNSPHNVLFFTERCNSRCLMCSQPPRTADDSWLIDDIFQTIPLMDISTGQLCISGGEPTLLFDRFVEVVQAVKEHLPQTALHVLSNGRLFSYLRLAESLAEAEHPNITIGIPLYSDVPSRHDFVVQAKGAFDETVQGIMNLARVKQQIEIRVVIHRFTADRLESLARFISRNMPYVAHVALMGLEPTGFAKSNIEELWIDPIDYHRHLAEAVDILDTAGLNVSIYNHPLCLLGKELWPFARQSISDWKNIYVPECEGCELMEACSGLFASASRWHSRGIKPLKQFEGRLNGTMV